MKRLDAISEAQFDLRPSIAAIHQALANAWLPRGLIFPGGTLVVTDVLRAKRVLRIMQVNHLTLNAIPAAGQDEPTTVW